MELISLPHYSIMHANPPGRTVPTNFPGSLRKLANISEFYPRILRVLLSGVWLGYVMVIEYTNIGSFCLGYGVEAGCLGHSLTEQTE